MRIQSGKEGRQTKETRREEMIKASEESKNNKANEDRWKEEGRKWKFVTKERNGRRK